MDLRRVSVLLLLVALGCTNAAPLPRDAADAGGAGEPEQGNPKVVPTSYQADPELDAAGADPTREVEPNSPATELQLLQLFQAVQQMQARLDDLQNQNLRMMAALGINQQDPQGPPPAGSLAARIDELHESVTMLALDNASLHRSIDEKVVALRPVLPTARAQGRLTVENNTDRDQQMWVNGIPYWIWARSRLSVEVPVGEVTTKVVGEPAQTWNIEAPNYQERIELVPATDDVQDDDQGGTS